MHFLVNSFSHFCLVLMCRYVLCHKMRKNNDEGISEPILERRWIGLLIGLHFFSLGGLGVRKKPIYVSPPARCRQVQAADYSWYRPWVIRDRMMIKRSVPNMIRRPRMCLQEEGRHIEHLLEKNDCFIVF